MSVVGSAGAIPIRSTNRERRWRRDDDPLKTLAKTLIFLPFSQTPVRISKFLCAPFRVRPAYPPSKANVNAGVMRSLPTRVTKIFQTAIDRSIHGKWSVTKRQAIVGVGIVDWLRMMTFIVQSKSIDLKDFSKWTIHHESSAIHVLATRVAHCLALA
jgi:hypothetical protein